MDRINQIISKNHWHQKFGALSVVFAGLPFVMLFVLPFISLVLSLDPKGFVSGALDMFLRVTPFISVALAIVGITKNSQRGYPIIALAINAFYFLSPFISF